MRSILALALATVSFSPAVAMPLHQFSDLALSPRGDRIVAVETDQEPNASTRPQEHAVIRDSHTGAVISTLPACAGCTYQTPSMCSTTASGSSAGSIAISW